jgi:hypothetical protein
VIKKNILPLDGGGVGGGGQDLVKQIKGGGAVEGRQIKTPMTIYILTSKEDIWETKRGRSKLYSLKNHDQDHGRE